MFRCSATLCSWAVPVFVRVTTSRLYWAHDSSTCSFSMDSHMVLIWSPATYIYPLLSSCEQNLFYIVGRQDTTTCQNGEYGFTSKPSPGISHSSASSSPTSQAIVTITSHHVGSRILNSPVFLWFFLQPRYSSTATITAAHFSFTKLEQRFIPVNWYSHARWLLGFHSQRSSPLWSVSRYQKSREAFRRSLHDNDITSSRPESSIKHIRIILVRLPFYSNKHHLSTGRNNSWRKSACSNLLKNTMQLC